MVAGKVKEWEYNSSEWEKVCDIITIEIIIIIGMESKGSEGYPCQSIQLFL